MTEIILVGIIAAASALLGVWITQHYESKKRNLKKGDGMQTISWEEKLMR